ncbi:hypothetical protein BDY17DRAFT_201963 [Neohortaea acidophila]|uniref:Uncharacterized protein n=1 Tax=Neohortaea acidophila TaxID=245834 RepID=A0A6A6PN73_9PEZI|nr:uncharacterized protein BDY17DRAFT_201963 [Neohortaea acidophila]KAF2480883.1 hypothetical protein BDY17DRAFT_201963 [Neohortaea acidophila]
MTLSHRPMSELRPTKTSRISSPLRRISGLGAISVRVYCGSCNIIYDLSPPLACYEALAIGRISMMPPANQTGSAQVRRLNVKHLPRSLSSKTSIRSSICAMDTNVFSTQLLNLTCSKSLFQTTRQNAPICLKHRDVTPDCLKTIASSPFSSSGKPKRRITLVRALSPVDQTHRAPHFSAVGELLASPGLSSQPAVLHEPRYFEKRNSNHGVGARATSSIGTASA